LQTQFWQNHKTLNFAADQKFMLQSKQHL